MKPFDFGEINLEAEPSGGAIAIRDTERPFRIALLGDFSGRASRGLAESGAQLANREAVAVDRDNFDEVLAKLRVSLDLPVGTNNHTSTLHFSELDDFHPDRIFERCELFQRLREIRTRLKDPSTFTAMAAELGVGRERVPPDRSQPEARSVAPNSLHIGSGNLLDEIVDQSEPQTATLRPSRSPDELHEFIRRVTEPHLTSAADPRQGEIIGVVDRAASAQMSALLHAPAFQDLEAAWRAVYFLVRRIDTSSQLSLHLIDVSKAELEADLRGAQDLRATGLYQLLVENSVRIASADPWSILVGNYSFGPEVADAELLGRIAKIAQASGAPFIAGANPREWAASQEGRYARSWGALRGLQAASSLGLTLPRFLLRLPYGAKTDPIDSFDFEEMPQPSDHEDYVWGNSAFACALLLAQAFSEDGWDMRPGSCSEVDGLPLHTYTIDAESALKPCAEALLTDAVVELILENGVMPFVSLKGTDSIRLARFQSVADPPAPLAGPWSRR